MSFRRIWYIQSAAQRPVKNEQQRLRDTEKINVSEPLCLCGLYGARSLRGRRLFVYRCLARMVSISSITRFIFPIVNSSG